MSYFSEEISTATKVSILIRTGIKFLRGLRYRVFLHRASGLFLVGKHVQITSGNRITCGKNVKFEDFSEIQGLARSGLVFGDNVTISRGVMIRPSSYYGGNLGEGLIVGDNSSFGPDTYVGCAGKIIIGQNVMFGPKCSLFAENHVFDDNSSSIKSQGVIQKGIIIKDNCWIGSNCIILDGVTIGAGCVIGAGTLVSRDVPADTVMLNKRNVLYKTRQ